MGVSWGGKGRGVWARLVELRRLAWTLSSPRLQKPSLVFHEKQASSGAYRAYLLALMGALPFTRTMDVFGKTRITLPTEILGLNQFNIFICNQFWRTLYRQIHGCWSFFHGMRLNINIFCTRLFPLLTTLVRLCSFRIVCVYSKQWSWDMYCFMD